MRYLYGDSTPSSLEVNFVDFLRDSLDFCVQVVLSTAESHRESELCDVLERETRTTIERLERLSSVVSESVQSMTAGSGDTAITRCAREIVTSASNLVLTEVERVNVALQAELAKLDAAQAGEREKCVKALETFVLRHDLPDSDKSLTLKARPGASYAAQLRASTPLGIAMTLELDVPSAHLFGHVVRVDRIVERLEVQAPEVGGWLHKERRMKAQRLEKLHVVELVLDKQESTVKLRAAADGSGSGFDVFIRPEASRVSIMRVTEREAPPDPLFDLEGADANSVLGLMEKLNGAARELMSHRKALVSANLDDQPLRDHTSPTVLVERLVGAIAPDVREIAVRSPSATELVLKRLVSGDRREEIFVAKAELREKIERLPPPLRDIFEPLGLGDVREGIALPLVSRPARESREPTTLVMSRRSSEADAKAADEKAAEPPSDPSPREEPAKTIEQIDAGFDAINLHDEKATVD